jgi:sporulation integral membrane protein YtvI
MSSPLARKLGIIGAALLGLWFGLKYLLPIATPFLLGAALAFSAEPLVHFFQEKCRLRRIFSTAIGVTVSLVLAALLVLMLAAFILREMKNLAGVIPDLEGTALNGISLLKDWLLSAARNAPTSVQPLLQQLVQGLFSGGTAVLDEITSRLLGFASAVLSRIPDSALGLGTMVIAAYMISGKLPQLRQLWQDRLPGSWRQRYFPAIQRLKDALWGWLQAQLKLITVTFLLLTGGFLLLRISHGPLWAGLIALVDAVPILGTGTVLIPWAAVSFLQGAPFRALGLLGLYGATSLTRSVLEPKLVGKQLGLDPLLTLAAMYTGYRVLGIPGLIFSPLIAVCILSVIQLKF